MVIIVFNAITTANVAYHVPYRAESESDPDDDSRSCHCVERITNRFIDLASIRVWLEENRFASALLESLFDASIPILMLPVGLVLQGEASRCRNAAAHGGYGLTEEIRLAYRLRHDLLHGTWHWMACTAILSMALATHRGLSSSFGERGQDGRGVLPPPSRRYHKEETFAKALLVGMTLLLLLLLPFDQAPIAYIYLWLLLLCVSLPISALWLFRVIQASDQSWASRMAALRFGTEMKEQPAVTRTKSIQDAVSV